MAGRGRGGRGGRGGVTKSFNREQLNTLGVGSNELLPGIVTQPPDLYPLLDRKPVPLVQSMEIDYLLILKQDFIDHMQLSPSYLKLPHDKNKQPEQEIDKLVAQLPSVKEKYDWRLFPAELRPKILAKRVDKVKTAKKVDVESRLNQLEKFEVIGDNNIVKVEDNDEAQDDAEAAEEDQDEEMDDGTDYANNYFDNGEDYEDEDDNLDDGPIF